MEVLSPIRFTTDTVESRPSVIDRSSVDSWQCVRSGEMQKYADAVHRILHTMRSKMNEHLTIDLEENCNPQSGISTCAYLTVKGGRRRGSRRGSRRNSRRRRKSRSRRRSQQSNNQGNANNGNSNGNNNGGNSGGDGNGERDGEEDSDNEEEGNKGNDSEEEEEEEEDETKSKKEEKENEETKLTCNEVEEAEENEWILCTGKNKKRKRSSFAQYHEELHLKQQKEKEELDNKNRKVSIGETVYELQIPNLDGNDKSSKTNSCRYSIDFNLEQKKDNYNSDSHSSSYNTKHKKSSKGTKCKMNYRKESELYNIKLEKTTKCDKYTQEGNLLSDDHYSIQINNEPIMNSQILPFDLTSSDSISNDDVNFKLSCPFSLKREPNPYKPVHQYVTDMGNKTSIGLIRKCLNAHMNRNITGPIPNKKNSKDGHCNSVSTIYYDLEMQSAYLQDTPIHNESQNAFFQTLHPTQSDELVPNEWKEYKERIQEFKREYFEEPNLNCENPETKNEWNCNQSNRNNCEGSEIVDCNDDIVHCFTGCFPNRAKKFARKIQSHMNQAIPRNMEQNIKKFKDQVATHLPKNVKSVLSNASSCVNNEVVTECFNCSIIHKNMESIQTNCKKIVDLYEQSIGKCIHAIKSNLSFTNSCMKCLPSQKDIFENLSQIKQKNNCLHGNYETPRSPNKAVPSTQMHSSTQKMQPPFSYRGVYKKFKRRVQRNVNRKKEFLHDYCNVLYCDQKDTIYTDGYSKMVSYGKLPYPYQNQSVSSMQSVHAIKSKISDNASSPKMNSHSAANCSSIQGNDKSVASQVPSGSFESLKRNYSNEVNAQCNPFSKMQNVCTNMNGGLLNYLEGMVPFNPPVKNEIIFDEEKNVFFDFEDNVYLPIKDNVFYNIKDKLFYNIEYVNDYSLKKAKDKIGEFYNYLVTEKYAPCKIIMRMCYRLNTFMYNLLNVKKLESKYKKNTNSMEILVK